MTTGPDGDPLTGSLLVLFVQGRRQQVPRALSGHFDESTDSGAGRQEPMHSKRDRLRSVTGARVTRPASVTSGAPTLAADISAAGKTVFDP